MHTQGDFCRSSRKFIMAIIVIIIIAYSWLPVSEKHLQKANNDGAMHRGNEIYCGFIHIKTKTKKQLFF